MIFGLRLGFLLVGVSASAITCAPPVVAQAPATRPFDIAAQPAENALVTFMEQAGVDIVYSSGTVAGIETKAVRGRYAPLEALELMLSGTGLTSRMTVSGGIVIRRVTGNEDEKESQANVALDEIVVTGTNIRGANPTLNTFVISRDDIAKRGHASVDDVLRTLPQNFASTTPTTTGISADNLAFGSSPNLRGLGADSTLVLLNGRRISASGGNFGGSIDVSALPVGAIERVEVLTDGASAIYGADAVGGVVNFVLRQKFNGMETSVRYGYGGAGRGKADDITISQVVGTSWQSGNLLVAGDYSLSQRIASRAVGIISSDLRPRGGNDFRASDGGQPGLIRPLNSDGLFVDSIAGNPPSTVASAVAPLGPARALTLDDIIPSLSSDGNAVPRDISPRQQPFSLFATLEQELTPTIRLFADAAYAERRVDIVGDRRVESVDVPTTNPFSPFSEPVNVAFSPLNEFGPIRQQSRTRLLSLTGGLKVDLRGDWKAEILGSRSTEKGKFVDLNDVDSNALQDAVNDSNPLTAYNPFGDGTGQNPATLDRILRERVQLTRTSVTTFSASASGSLLRLPAGPVKLALGAEHREERLRTFDAIVDQEPERTVRAAYFETLLPVLGAGEDGGKQPALTLSFAGRLDDYSDFGSAFSPRLSAALVPVEGLSMRANWNKSFRAPQLFEIAGRGFQSSLIFPDLLAPGGPRNVSVNVVAGGFRDLKPERAETFSLGLSYEPAFLPGLSLEGNYFDIQFNQRIISFAQIELAEIAELEEAGGLPPGIVIRDEGGNLQTLDRGFFNAASTDMSGLDFSASWTFSALSGDAVLSVAGTKLFAKREKLLPSSPVVDVIDTLGEPNDFRLRGEVGWSSGPFSSHLVFNHTSAYQNRSVYIDRFTLDVLPIDQRVSAFNTVDLQFSVTSTRQTGFLRGTTARLGATNLFNAKPPFVNDGRRLGLDAEQADIRGRVIYLQLTKGFGHAAQ